MRVTGVGIHSGARVTVHLHRSDAQHWIHFRRRPSAGKHYLIPAHADYIRATPRCTVLGLRNLPESYIATVEHLLAACVIAGWWRGLLIEVDGAELPILDGSAQGWLEHLQQLGPPPALPRPYALKRSKRYRLRRTRIVAEPAPALRLETSIAFPQAVIGQQRWQGGVENFGELSDARTFGFVEELELLQKHSFALGANLENVLVFSQSEAIVTPRYSNEPVRHKALDALGDFLLLGRPLQAHIRIHRGSHQAHSAFIKQLLRRQRHWLELTPSANASALG